MPSWVYNPECPYANENGMVEKTEYLTWKYYNSPDNRMMNGNTPVSLNFISDEMEPTRHMANGKLYTSKKKFRNETRARGCIEVGDDKSIVELKPRKPVKLDKRQRREDIKKSIYQLRNGMVPARG